MKRVKETPINPLIKINQNLLLVQFISKVLQKHVVCYNLMRLQYFAQL